MSWNPVLNLFIEMKEKAQKTLPNIWEYKNDTQYSSCMQYWAERLGIPLYQDILQGIRVNEHENLILVRYNDYFRLFANKENGEKSIYDYENFWFMYDGLFRECRGVVIDIEKNCLVLTPFQKFFNMNEFPETSEKEIREKMKKASVIEFSDKLDGSMQSARYYDGKIVMAGSQAIDPEQSWRLTDGYQRLTENHKKMIMENPNKTFVFEYLSRKDAHIVRYDKEGLFLIGMRDVHTGKESDYRDILHTAMEYHVPTTRLFDKTLDEVIGELDKKKANEAEGFVLNIDGYKVKIKYDDYIGLSKLIMSISSENTIIKAVADDSLDDVLAKLPEVYRKDIQKTVQFIYHYIKTMGNAVEYYYSMAPKDSRKDFMIWTEKNIPKFLKNYLRMKYVWNSVDYLKSRNGRYIKMPEIKENLSLLESITYKVT